MFKSKKKNNNNKKKHMNIYFALVRQCPVQRAGMHVKKNYNKN